MEWAVGKGYDLYRPDSGKLLLPGAQISWKHIHAVGETDSGQCRTGHLAFSRGRGAEMSHQQFFFFFLSFYLVKGQVFAWVLGAGDPGPLPLQGHQHRQRHPQLCRGGRPHDRALDDHLPGGVARAGRFGDLHRHLHDDPGGCRPRRHQQHGHRFGHLAQGDGRDRAVLGHHPRHPDPPPLAHQERQHRQLQRCGNGRDLQLQGHQHRQRHPHLRARHRPDEQPLRGLLPLLTLLVGASVTCTATYTTTRQTSTAGVSPTRARFSERHPPVRP